MNTGISLVPALALALTTVVLPRVARAELAGTIDCFGEPFCTIEGASGEDIDFSVYLPPGYDPNGTRRYPVVYHLHGLNGTHDGRGGLGGGAGQLAIVPASHEDAVARGLVEPVIIVFPDGYGDSFWADSFPGVGLAKPAESDVISKIIPYVDQEFLTQPVRGRRIVQGFSMGGFGAAKFAAKFPELFGAGVLYDAALLTWPQLVKKHPDQATLIFNDDADYFDEFSPWHWVPRNASDPDWPVPFRQAVGALLEPYNVDFQKHLIENGNVPSFIDTPAGHDLRSVLDSPDPPDSSRTVGQVSWGFIQAVFDAAGPVPLPSISIAADDGWVAAGGSLNATEATLLVGDNASRQQVRSVLSFDTSSLPAGATILSASVTLTRTGGAGSTATFGTLQGDVRRGAFGTAPLTAGDFQAPATVVGGLAPIVVPASGKSTTAQFTTSGLTAINPAGRTQIRLTFSIASDNDGVADNVAFGSSNHATLSARPVLQVTYR